MTGGYIELDPSLVMLEFCCISFSIRMKQKQYIKFYCKIGFTAERVEIKDPFQHYISIIYCLISYKNISIIPPIISTLTVYCTSLPCVLFIWVFKNLSPDHSLWRSHSGSYTVNARPVRLIAPQSMESHHLFTYNTQISQPFISFSWHVNAEFLVQQVQAVIHRKYHWYQQYS